MSTYRDIFVCSIAMVMGFGGCFFDSSGVASGDGSVDAGDRSDATGPGADGAPDAPSGPDAPGPDAPVPDMQLLITEVTLAPTAGEFIEIFNPGAQAVDLTNYYLADTSEYARLPGLTGDSENPNVDPQYDFIARFLAGPASGLVG